MSSINLKPNKPDTYDGRRDFLTVNTWIYKVEQFLNLSQLSSPETLITDLNRIQFASSYLTGNAAVWWFNVVNGVDAPTSWEGFRTKLVEEFIPADHNRQARDKLRRLRQNSSVEKYLCDFRNTILMISNISEDEKTDKFVSGLKYDLKLEVLKSRCNSFEECARMALSVDSAIWGAKTNSFSQFHQAARTGPTPMEIGNVNAASSSMTPREQRRQDLSRRACFKCHKTGCRPWKCDPQGARAPRMNVNNTQLQEKVNESTIENSGYVSEN